MCASSANCATALLPTPMAVGHQAALCLSRLLRERGLVVRRVSLPEGHDPNSFFTSGGDARQFQALLARAAQ